MVVGLVEVDLLLGFAVLLPVVGFVVLVGLAVVDVFLAAGVAVVVPLLAL